MDRELRARAKSAPWENAIEILVMNETYGRMHVGAPLIMRPAEAGDEVVPTFRLDKDQAQALMDDLWNCGLRPTEGAGSAGALAATQRHLDDMRRLVFDNVAARRPDIRAARPGELNEGAR